MEPIARYINAPPASREINQRKINKKCVIEPTKVESRERYSDSSAKASPICNPAPRRRSGNPRTIGESLEFVNPSGLAEFDLGDTQCGISSKLSYSEREHLNMIGHLSLYIGL